MRTTYTEADVERDKAKLTHGLQAWSPSQEDLLAALGARDSLAAAALDGAKMPALVEQLRVANESGSEAMRNAAAYRNERDALQAQVATLTADMIRVNNAASEAIQKTAQVMLRASELERERDEARRQQAVTAKSLKDAMENAERFASERDALRAQVAAARNDLLDHCCGLQNQPADCAMCKAIATALSAPPAETTPAAEETCPNCGHEEHRCARCAWCCCYA